MVEARQIYERPGPFAHRREREATFEQYLQRIYLDQGFVQEIRGGQPVLVLRPG